MLKRTVSIDTNKCSYIFHNDKISSSGDKDFSIIHINKRSFNKNDEAVNIFHNSDSIDNTFSVICISETWFYNYDDMFSKLRIMSWSFVVMAGGWCARGPRIETRGNRHIISHPISRQIGLTRSAVRVIDADSVLTTQYYKIG